MRRIWKLIAPYFAYFLIVVSFAVTLAIVRYKDCEGRREARADNNEILLEILNQFPQSQGVLRIEQLIRDRPALIC